MTEQKTLAEALYGGSASTPTQDTQASGESQQTAAQALYGDTSMQHVDTLNRPGKRGGCLV